MIQIVTPDYIERDANGKIDRFDCSLDIQTDCPLTEVNGQNVQIPVKERHVCIVCGKKRYIEKMIPSFRRFCLPKYACKKVCYQKLH